MRKRVRVFIGLVVCLSLLLPGNAGQAARKKERKTVKIIAVGDNLIHQRIIDSGKQKDGSYDYTGLYANFRDVIAPYDVRIINQEVILTADKSKWAGYPSFASPREIGEAVVDAGFNVITHATNHSWDKGKAGADSTIKYWKSKDVLMTGMYRSQKEYDAISVGEYNGVRIAFLNYTYGLNGKTLKDSEKYYVRLLQETQIRKDIKAAKKVADFIIVLPHWGIEYQNSPSKEQRSLAQKMADWGADLIIGTHPHVVQPLHKLKAADGRIVPCYYSLGDFMANMGRPERDLGGIAMVTLEKTADGVKVKSAYLGGCIIQINKAATEYTVYKLGDYTEELATQHLDNLFTQQLSKKWLQAELKRIKVLK